MTSTIIELRKLTPSEGMWLTNATVEDEKCRIISDCVYLGNIDSPDNWIEWTDEQKQTWERLYQNNNEIIEPENV